MHGPSRVGLATAGYGTGGWSRPLRPTLRYHRAPVFARPIMSFEYAGLCLSNNLLLAPMAGVTDKPFRTLCRELGAGLAISEMVTSNALLYGAEKTLKRVDHRGEPGPIAVQIAGADPDALARAAQHQVALGAVLIDLNLGCPAKKVCNVAAGSALMRDPVLVARIFRSVVAAVPDTPVTVKMRTGWDHGCRNAPLLAQMAEDAGLRAVTVHGRTRADQYRGQAEYDTIAEVKRSVRIPVVANGDIDSPARARAVLAHTGVDALMIGRAAQGRPWLFREIAAVLAGHDRPAPPDIVQMQRIVWRHIDALHQFYGPGRGLRVARKHFGWYTKGVVAAGNWRQAFFLLDSTAAQLEAVDAFFEQLRVEDQDLVCGCLPKDLAA